MRGDTKLKQSLKGGKREVCYARIFNMSKPAELTDFRFWEASTSEDETDFPKNMDIKAVSSQRFMATFRRRIWGNMKVLKRREGGQLIIPRELKYIIPNQETLLEQIIPVTIEQKPVPIIAPQPPKEIEQGTTVLQTILEELNFSMDNYENLIKHMGLDMLIANDRKLYEVLKSECGIDLLTKKGRLTYELCCEYMYNLTTVKGRQEYRAMLEEELEEIHKEVKDTILESKPFTRSPRKPYYAERRRYVGRILRNPKALGTRGGIIRQPRRLRENRKKTTNPELA